MKRNPQADAVQRAARILSGRASQFQYAVEFTDHHPTLGGKTEVQGWHTQQEAKWYAELEVEAARELGMSPVTFRVIRLA